MSEPTYEQLVALEDAVGVVFDAGFSRDEVTDRVDQILDELESEEDD